MGLAVSGDAATSAGNSAADEGDEVGNEDESIVHHCASVGDVEVWQSECLDICSSPLAYNLKNLDCIHDLGSEKCTSLWC